MNSESRDESLHGAACGESITVSIVADGSHHGANAFGVSSQLQHDTDIEQDDKNRSPSNKGGHRSPQSDQTPRESVVRTPTSRSAVAWLLRAHVRVCPKICKYMTNVWRSSNLAMTNASIYAPGEVLKVYHQADLGPFVLALARYLI